jgi:O-methyltransferase
MPLNALKSVWKKWSRRWGGPVPDTPSVQHLLPRLSTPEEGIPLSAHIPVFWGAADHDKVKGAVKSVLESVAGGSFFGDNLLTWGRNMSLLEDQPFMQAWQSNAESVIDQAIIWRRYVLACAAYHCVQLGGDFVECGAYKGIGVKTVVDYLGGTRFPRTFWAYDTFEHDATMANPAMPGHGADLYDKVRQKFQDYPQVRIVQGLIPDVFQQHMPEKIAYLHIDLNQAQAEVAALDALFERMVPGGILVLDDYEWSGVYRSQKLAEDVWFQERNYRVMPLPTGQGLVFKR